MEQAATSPQGLAPRDGLRDFVGRRFYSIAAAIVLVVTFVGFQPFFLHGAGLQGRIISRHMMPIVIVHCIALTGWVVAVLAQSLLIAKGRRELHMALGWWLSALALAVSISGVVVAVRSVHAAPTVPFWGMHYRQFLLIMLAEIALFIGFVVAGVLTRATPTRHRAMMLLANLSIVTGATVRMPILFPIFGKAGWEGVFGPTFVLGAAFVLIRSATLAGIDEWLTGGFAAMVVGEMVAVLLATSSAWDQFARIVFGV